MRGSGAEQGQTREQTGRREAGVASVAFHRGPHLTIAKRPRMIPSCASIR